MAANSRKWVFRLVALLIPLALLGALEAGLRIAGYGYSTDVFKEVDSPKGKFLEFNDSFCLRFFPPELARTPAPIRIPAVKPLGTYRIFIFGESAAMGDPEPAFGAGRYLQVLLNERYPGEHFEVVNLGITAINSHVILPLAEGCASQQGDLWLIYMGNNEMVGPFGAATIFGAQAPRWQFVRLGLAVQRTRTGELLMALARKLSGKSAPAPTWMGMQMFAQNRVRPDDPRKDTVYRNFHRNLDDILECGIHSGAHVLLSTVAVNLKDCPPFASLEVTNLPPRDQAPFEKLRDDGARAEHERRLADAAQAWAQAAKIAPLSAEAQFHLGDCLLRSTNATTAGPPLQQACDVDALPFRADSRINGLIREAGDQFAGRGVVLLDSAAALETNGPAPILGDETFYEHVHFNFDGNYRLARIWAAAVAQQLPPALVAQATTGWADQEFCKRRLGLTDWDRCNVIEGVLRRMQQAPLNSQSNNPVRVAALQSQMAAMRRAMDAADATHAREIYTDALVHAPADHNLHENFADFLEATGDTAGASAEWQKVHELLPDDYLADFHLGTAFASQGRTAEAEASLNAALKTRPDLADAWLTLGKVHAADGKLEAALNDYRRAEQLHPQDAEVHFYSGKALSQLNRSEAALEEFRRAIAIRPEYWEAHYALGGQLGYAGQIGDATSEFEEVLRLKPDFAPAHLNLGVALMKSGKLDDAAHQFEETLRLDPANKTAADYLRQARAGATGDRPQPLH